MLSLPLALLGAMLVRLPRITRPGSAPSQCLEPRCRMYNQTVTDLSLFGKISPIREKVLSFPLALVGVVSISLPKDHTPYQRPSLSLL